MKTILAKLASGETVTLQKECGCLDEIHVGPHWLYMNTRRRESNCNLRRAALMGRNLTLLVFVAGDESKRCAEKASEMERRGIVEILIDG